MIAQSFLLNHENGWQSGWMSCQSWYSAILVFPTEPGISYNLRLLRIKFGEPVRDAEVFYTSEYRIAIITAETSTFPDMQHFLAPRFTASLAQNEKQIQ